MKKRPKKRNMIFVRTDDQLKNKLERAAYVIGSDVSTLLRDAATEKLARLCAENKDVARALKASAAA
jgi:predicted transcriptional regulator